MPFPLLLGLTPLGGGALHQESFDALKRLQGEGAYDDDEDGARLRELLAWAEMHANARQLLERVSANIMPDKALELLSAWENYLRVPNNAPRTIEERQARAQQFYDLIVQADATTLAAFVAELGSSATLATPTRATVSGHSGVSAEAILHVMIKLSTAQYEDPPIRRAFDIIARILPACNLGQLSRPADFSQQVYTTDDAEYDAAQYMGRTALHNGTSRTFANARNPARFRDYGPLSLIRAADLNAIQEAYVFEGIAGVGGTPAAEDSLYRFFSLDVADATEAEVDTADWRDRHVTIYLRASTSDIRPGAANDDDANDLNLNFTTTMYTGTGATGVPPQTYDAEFPSGTNLWARAKSSDGKLAIYNDTGSTLYIIGCAFASGDTGER